MEAKRRVMFPGIQHGEGVYLETDKLYRYPYGYYFESIIFLSCSFSMNKLSDLIRSLIALYVFIP